SDNPDNYGSNPTRTVTWVLNDGSGSFNLSTTQTETVSITAINDAPTLSAATSAAWTEGTPPTTLSATTSVTDPDDLTLISATVQVVGGTFAADGDVLAGTGNGTISVSYNSTTETLTLTGSDTLADYQTVLDTITFNSTADNPTNFGSNATRTLVWTVNDGGASSGTSTPVTTTVSITNVNDAPTLANVPASATYTENSAAVTLAGSASVSDPDTLKLVNATVKV